MPELPDLTVYVEHLERRLVGQPLEAIRIANPFVLRSVEPTVDTRAKISGIFILLLTWISSSKSQNGKPNLAARARPTLLLPEPGGPYRQIKSRPEDMLAPIHGQVREAGAAQSLEAGAHLF